MAAMDTAALKVPFASWLRNWGASMAATAGRYKDIARATIPGELPPAGRISAVRDIRHAVVADPNPALRGRKQRAAVNVSTDALEFEYARGSVSDAGYWAARTYQAVLEKSRRPVSAAGAWNPGDRVDQVLSHELKVLRGIEAAQDAVAMLRDTGPVIGQIGGRVLELVLIEGLTLKAVDLRMGGRGERMGVYFHSEVFRRSCEDLADHWCGRRKRAPKI